MRKEVSYGKLVEIQQSPEYREKVERIENYLKQAGGEIERDHGLQTTTGLRITPTQFPYSDNDLADDEKDAETAERNFKRRDVEDASIPEMRAYNEQLEMLKSAIFHKNLKQKYVVVRSARYDDIKNGVDNVLININTGRPICAFDEVPLADPRNMEEKKAKVVKRNTQEHGVSLKYGVSFSGKGKNRKLELGPLENLPIFYLTLPRSQVAEGIRSFDPDSERSEGYEKKIYKFLLSLVAQEISMMELQKRRLVTEMAESIKHLDRIIRGELNNLDK